MKLPSINNILQKIKTINLKIAINKIIKYDYKKPMGDIKNFNYKSSQAYKNLLQDKSFWKRLVWCVIAIVLLSMVRGCVFRPKEPPLPARPVDTCVIVEKDVPIYLETFATLSSTHEVDIQAQITGQIKDVHFNNGDYVSKGDPLYTIDPSEYKARLDKTRASLAQSLADLKLKMDILERNKRLVERDLISKQDYETMQTELVSAQARVDLDRAQLELAKIDLGYCLIVSPLEGVTSKGFVDPGNIVIANDGPVLVNIKTIDPLNIDFTLSERELSRVRDAMAKDTLRVEIWPEGEKDSYEGKLVFIDNAVDKMTGTIFARASVDNAGRKLWAGQFVTVRLVLAIQKNAVLAPYSAVKIGQKGHYLFVFTEESKADLKNIKVGLRQGEYIIVEEGVKPGDRVITSGILGLYPGAVVVDLKAGMDAKKQAKKR